MTTPRWLARGEQLLDAFGRKYIPLSGGDRLRFWAPTFVSAICALLVGARAFAGADFAIGGAARSYPLSGVIEGEAGYGALLWGERGSPFSGYVRSRLDGSTAGTYNSLGGALEVFPLAFLGARAGGESIQNDVEYTAYDCDRYGCMGRFYRTYIEGELTLGAGPVFIQGRARRERWTRKDPRAGDFIDPTSGLVLAGEGDSETVYTAIAGVKLSERWTLLALGRYAEAENRAGLSRTSSLAVRYRYGNFSVGAGAGVFESSIKARDFSAAGFFSWEIVPGLALR